MIDANKYAKGRLLDVGCGFRPYEAIFANRVTDYLGMDWKSSPGRAQPDIVGDAMNIPVSQDTFDTVLATEVMEHLPSPEDFIIEVARVLRGMGTFIVSVHFMEPLHDEPRDFYRFTPYSLQFLLQDHGFQVIQIWAKGGWWSVVLGSFVNQTLYEWANPTDEQGRRQDKLYRILPVLPFCAMAQFVGYTLDRVFKSSRYTLGYVAVATYSNQRSLND